MARKDCPSGSEGQGIKECDEIKRLPVNESYGCCQLIIPSCTKRKKYRECDGKYPTTLHGLWVKTNNKSKSEKVIKEKKEIKTNSTGLICASVKINQVITVCVVIFKVRHKNCSQGNFVKTNFAWRIEGRWHKNSNYIQDFEWRLESLITGIG